jgi:hydrogenase maturation protease
MPCTSSICASPDLLFGFDADVAIRNVIGVAGKFPELAVQAVLMRKYGQEIIKATAGKKIHGTGAIPGGVNKNLSIAERDVFLKDIDQHLAWAKSAVKIAKDYTVAEPGQAGALWLLRFQPLVTGPQPTVPWISTMAICAPSMPRATTIFDQVDYQRYVDFIAEEVRDWSYMKFPFIRSIGPEKGWYRVGPLARLNTATFIDTPLAEAERKEFRAVTAGKPNNITMAYHWARMIELLHSMEKIQACSTTRICRARIWWSRASGARSASGLSRRHAEPCSTTTRWTRMTLSRQANLIVSTTHNNEPMNRAVAKVAQDHLAGRGNHRGLAQPRRGCHSRLRPVLVLRHPRAWPDADGNDLARSPGADPRSEEQGMTGIDTILLYGFGNPGRGDDGLGPALGAAIEELGIPNIAVDANYQLTVEDAAEIAGYDAVVFADAAMQGPTPFWFSRIDDSAIKRGNSMGNSLGWTSHSVSPVQVVALARDLFASKVAAYALGIRGYAFGDLDEALSSRAIDNLTEAVTFARKALIERQFEHYVQEFGHPAVGEVTGSSTWKA